MQPCGRGETWPDGRDPLHPAAVVGPQPTGHRSSGSSERPRPLRTLRALLGAARIRIGGHSRPRRPTARVVGGAIVRIPVRHRRDHRPRTIASRRRDRSRSVVVGRTAPSRYAYHLPLPGRRPASSSWGTTRISGYVGRSVPITVRRTASGSVLRARAVSRARATSRLNCSSEDGKAWTVRVRRPGNRTCIETMCAAGPGLVNGARTTGGQDASWIRNG